MTDEAFHAVEERRQQYIRAYRVEDWATLDRLTRAATSEDLEWWVQTLEAQLEETPHHVTEPMMLERFLLRNRTALTAARSRLAHRRTVENSSILSSANVAKWTAILSVLFSLAALIVAVIALMKA